METISQRSFSNNLKLMRFLNMYPSANATLLFKVQALCLYLMLIPPVPVLGTLYFLLEGEFTIEEFNENAFLIAEMACQVAKFLPFIIHGAQIKKCIHYFDSPEFTLKREKHKQIIDKCCWICRRNSKVFLYSIIAGILFFAIKPIFINREKLPADIWLPFNPARNNETFYFVYMFIVIGVAYASLACAAIDPLIGGLVCLATGQLKVLKDNLQFVNEYAKDYARMEIFGSSPKKARKERIMDAIIKQCVQQHIAILNFVVVYENSFSVSVFSQFCGSILVICFCCLQLSKLDPLSFNFISMSTFFSIVLGQIYVYCYYGTLLYEESNTLSEAIYMGTWYKSSYHSKQSLMILMERSKKPMIITVGKIIQMSVGTFTTILQRSYSLLAVLKNF